MYIKRALAVFATIMIASSITSSGPNNYTSIQYANESNIYPMESLHQEIIVKFKDDIIINISKYSNGITGTGLISIDSLNERYHVTDVEKIFKNNNHVSLSNIYKLILPKDINITTVTREYNKDSNVEYVEPNYVYHIYTIPNDPSFNIQWALNHSSDHDIDAPGAWDIEQGNEDIVIAVIDTGVDWDHPDLAVNIWSNTEEIIDGSDTDGNGYVDDIRGWDFVDTFDSVYPGEDGTVEDNDPMDLHGHGTHCSGIASAVTNNSVGIAGVCWNCSVMAVRAGYKGADGKGYLETDAAVAAIEYAVDNGADVISMSWGGSFISNMIKDALDYAYNNGVVLVAAAGNDDTDEKIYPAGYDNVIAVAATDSSDAKAWFSSYGSWVDVAAPGVNIYSTYFDDTYCYMHGTSMSCPHVAGVTGLILSQNPGFSQEEVKTILRSTTDNISPTKYIGIGRINAYKAMLRDSTPLAVLNSSLDDVVVSGTINIVGTANGSTFVNYTVFYGHGVYPSNWMEINNSTLPVNDSILTCWDTMNVNNGVYTIRLIVYDTSSFTSEDRAIVTVDNIAPIELTSIDVTTSDPIDTDPLFGWENITCTVTGILEIDTVFLNITYPDLHTENASMTDGGGGQYCYNTTFSAIGSYSYFIWVNDTSGNSSTSSVDIFQVPPNWDIEMDGVCGLSDLSKISIQYEQTGSNGWIREDVDNDGIVGLSDLSKVSIHYEETWP